MDPVGAKLHLDEAHLRPEGDSGAKPLPKPLLTHRITLPEKQKPASPATSGQQLETICLENSHDCFLNIVTGSEFNLAGKSSSEFRPSPGGRPTPGDEQEQQQPGAEAK